MSKEQMNRENPYIVDKKAIERPLTGKMEDYPNGIIFVLDKPYGWTSADAVRRVKFALQRKFGVKNIKVGHAGTLDPLATGVLLICAGKATKMADNLQSQKKIYIAEITFGATTPSFDLEKEIDETFPFEHITRERLESVLPQHKGEINQIPPVFSAKLIDGKRAYEIAREGGDAVMKPSPVTIYNLEIISFHLPAAELFIECSKGTYVRSLARDLGIALESGAHLTSLIRGRSGEFDVENAISMDNMKLFLQ
jgi:tRNA pseudouridine55 synthase